MDFSGSHKGSKLGTLFGRWMGRQSKHFPSNVLLKIELVSTKPQASNGSFLRSCIRCRGRGSMLVVLTEDGHVRHRP